ncbi:hypothetical protein G7043_29510 [Lentzea sp. NEAU-D13]|uniref:DUF2690 domain-containing protein n=1 Tax=Lentzea alba TaxID=2714351 RepID=A0A7C9RUJ5_9PSEU|nr:hypothetical protein [Lentzea alba]NGY63067.1 hypothetical protein [Lentzea alba]
MILLAAGMLVNVSPASAVDVGGNGNPYYDCPNAFTVASTNITRNGQVIGLVEMRWSWSCSGNWTRTTSYIGARSLYSAIDKNPNENTAYGLDYATQNWSPYWRVAASQPMCSYASIQDGGTYYYGTVCA